MTTHDERNTHASPIRCVVIGAGGYSGAEACDLLLAHPRAELVGVFASAKRAGADDGPTLLSDVFPRFRGRTALPLRATAVDAVRELAPGAVFLATPHEVSNELASELVDAGITVFDISGAFRLRDAQQHRAVYGFDRDPALVERAVYGLPEWNRDAIAHADLITCPGCYPTSAILPIRALVHAGAIDTSRPIIVDSVSGTSGAGRSPAISTLLSEQTVRAYKVFAHRHEPEIVQHAGAGVIFTPHLGPYDRGIVSTIHCELTPGWDCGRAREALERRYADEPFVSVVPEGAWPGTRDVERTNMCHIGLASGAHAGHASHLIVSSAIDNLVKGAAGQAVQCMNIRFAHTHGTRETDGLIGAPGAPDVPRAQAVNV